MVDISERCVVVAFFEPLEGQKEAVKAVLGAVIPDVHSEPGCEFYALHEDTRGRLVFIEAWQSRQHWVDHSGFETVATIERETEGLLAAPIDVIEMYGVPYGAEKGIIPLGS